MTLIHVIRFATLASLLLGSRAQSQTADKGRIIVLIGAPGSGQSGLVNESVGNTEKSVEYYRQAIAVEERSGKLQAETLLTLARLLLLLNGWDECTALLERPPRWSWTCGTSTTNALDC